MTVITRSKMPREKRLESRNFSSRVRRMLNSAGIGSAIRRMLVTILRLPKITRWPRASEQVPTVYR